MTDRSSWGRNPITALTMIIVGAVAIGGAVVVAVHPETLTFDAYLDDLWKFAAAAGLVGVGRRLPAAGPSSSATPLVDPALDDPAFALAPEDDPSIPEGGPEADPLQTLRDRVAELEAQRASPAAPAAPPASTPTLPPAA
jgi:hypothetical protein